MQRPDKLRGVQFISYADLARDIAKWAPRLPQDICAVVGLPRSGLTVAHMLASELNIPAMQIHGQEFRQETGRKLSRRAGRFLVVDDTCSCGTAMQEARRQVAGTPAYFAAVYARKEASQLLDFWYGQHAEPDWLVVTQWNLHAHQDSKWILFERDVLPLYAETAGTVQGSAEDLSRQYAAHTTAALLVTRAEETAWQVAAATGRPTLSTEAWRVHQNGGPGPLQSPPAASQALRTVTIIGKGPTASHAASWVRGDVCSINEAALVLSSDRPIEYCFFAHRYTAERTRPFWDRVRTFVSPQRLLSNEHDGSKAMDLPDGFPRHRRVCYGSELCPPDRKFLTAMLQAGQATSINYQTVTAAMSWLALHGYRHLRLIGCDGGRNYAAAFAGRPAPVMSRYREYEDMLAELLHELYGCTVERYGE